MRIDSNLGLAQGLRGEASDRAAKSRASAETGSLKEDVAELSSDGVSVSHLQARALDAPEIRSDKVDALRAAIQAGSYRPQPAQIANAMFDHLVAR